MSHYHSKVKAHTGLLCMINNFVLYIQHNMSPLIQRVCKKQSLQECDSMDVNASHLWSFTFY